MDAKACIADGFGHGFGWGGGLDSYQFGYQIGVQGGGGVDVVDGVGHGADTAVAVDVRHVELGHWGPFVGSFQVVEGHRFLHGRHGAGLVGPDFAGP